ncbi:stage III sporulation protein AG [Heyndrickxia oleronia]|uniref:stage III sporulation protein AG n=1 Tax=Heyndrickxia oleronia TaxID=38875 RepID=UPI001B23D526|nr:stage III sporulation protein AG [Heyndrickxia oleronia]GIN38331.1 stage III sporulation protein AG [Heyndrickxia oleronia]
MNNNKGPIDWLKEKLFQSKENDANKKNKKYQYLLILLVCGIAIMLISDIWKTGNKETSSTTSVYSATDDQKDVETFGSGNKDQNKKMKDYEMQYETELKDVLEQMSGVGKVRVIVNLAATESKVYEKNTVIQNQTTTETDQNGGERQIEDLSKDEKLVIIRDGDKEIPLITETKKPEIRGVLVVADGAKNISVKSMIIEAVSRALDVPTHKVSVQPKKN